MKSQVVILFCFWATALNAQVSAPKYSNEFLSLGVGGRAFGMAGNQVAICDDVTAGYWNPAGLTQIDTKYEGALMHTGYFAGLANYDYAGFTFATDSLGRFGLSLLRFAIDDIPDTRFLYDANGVIHYDNISFFSAADYALLLSYARKIPGLKNLRIGGSAKIIHRKAGEFAQAWGFGLDAGLQWAVKKNIKLGLLLKDFTGTFNAWSHNPALVQDVYNQTGNVIPENTIEVTLPRAIFGMAHSFNIQKFGWLTSLSLDLTFDGKRNTILKTDLISASPSLGLELDYNQMIFLRLGIGNLQNVQDQEGSSELDFQPDSGIGLQLGHFKLDYALTDLGNSSEVLYSHVFSLIYGFEKF